MPYSTTCVTAVMHDLAFALQTCLLMLSYCAPRLQDTVVTGTIHLGPR